MPDDEVALMRQLHDEHAEALWRFCLRLVGNDRGRAEDVVQETLLRAWRHPEALRPERGPVRPWLFTVARNLAIDARRARAVRPAEVPDTVLAVLPDEREDLDRVVDSWVVADALTSLRREHREVLVEVYYRARSVAEAAAVLRVPPGTVKSRTHYALRALKLALEERGITS